MGKEASEEERRASCVKVAALFGLDVESPRFVLATTHPSFAHESPSSQDNQRLEFLGDAILDFLISEDLYSRFPESNEGQLTRIRSQLVSTGALCRFAREHEVGSALRFGKGAGQGALHESENVLADAIEALLAATYLDHGVEAARRVSRMLFDFGMKSTQKAGAQDSKSEFQERVQAVGLRAPTYRLVGSEGPSHETTFEVEVSVNGHALARGKGRSKRLAEREAAATALKEEKYQSLLSGDEEASDEN